MVDIRVAYPLASSCNADYSSRTLGASQEIVDTRYQMVAFDLDGTLLQSNRRISDSTVEYLQSLDRRGLKLAFCTGRSSRSTYEHIQKLGLSRPFPVVCTNGAKGIFCNLDQRAECPREDMVFHKPLSREITSCAIQNAKKLNYVSMLYYDDAVYANESCEEHFTLTRLYMRLARSNVTHVEDNFESLMDEFGMPSRIVVLFLNASIEDVLASFETELGREATIIPGSKGWFLEILNSNKGRGLRDMCHHMDVPLEKCIALGDGENDVEFLTMAGLGICMKNGTESAKRAARAITEWTNNEDGVIRALQQLERLGLLRLDN